MAGNLWTLQNTNIVKIKKKYVCVIIPQVWFQHISLKHTYKIIQAQAIQSYLMKENLNLK
jgi:hypothetical protein